MDVMTSYVKATIMINISTECTYERSTIPFVKTLPSVFFCSLSWMAAENNASLTCYQPLLIPSLDRVASLIVVTERYSNGRDKII